MSNYGKQELKEWVKNITRNTSLMVFGFMMLLTIYDFGTLEYVQATRTSLMYGLLFLVYLVLIKVASKSVLNLYVPKETEDNK